MYHIQGDRIYIKPASSLLGLKMQYIGELIDGYFRCTDKDNYHYASDSLGIDKHILYADDLDYRFITFKFHGKTLITTRKFFIDNSKSKTLLNGRDQLFLPMKEFGLTKALKYEKDYNPRKIAEMDIFDVLAKNDPRLLKEWQSLLEEHQKIEDKSKDKLKTFKSRKIII